MRKRIVIWGSNDKDEKLLLALELNEKENTVDLFTFTEAVATQELYNKLMQEWRENKTLDFPTEHEKFTMPLSITDGILPDNIKTDRTDLINQAKAEWHFTVLSSKLYEYYSSELKTIKDKVMELSSYEQNMWDDIKTFWNKVQEQMKEENLFKGHGYKLKKSTNEVFDKLKELRKVLDTELNKASAIVKKEFMESLDLIEEKIDKGLGLQPIFNELKKLQIAFKKTEFSRSDQNKVWKRLDKAFKTLKEKKYGGKQNSGSSNFDRLKNRYDGLLNAISRMEQSLNRDKKDKLFQDRRIDKTDGQLELQLRQAKIVMIEQRISSKQDRLDDMLKTKADLEQQLLKAEAKHKRELKQKEVEAEKIKIKEKLEKELEESKASLDVDTEKLEKAAAEIKAAKVKKTIKKAEKELVETSEKSDKSEVSKIISEEAIAVDETLELIQLPTDDTLNKDSKPSSEESEKTKENKEKKKVEKQEPIQKTDIKKDKKQEIEASDKTKEKKAADNPDSIDIKKAKEPETSPISEIMDKVEDVVESASVGLGVIADFVEDKIEEFISDLKGEEE